MHSVFNDPILQKQFEQKGYVLLSSLLNTSEVERLLTLFSQFTAEANEAFHTTHFSNNLTYKQKVHDTIAALVYPKAAPVLNNFRPVFGNFMIKNPDAERFMPLHADWAYVDESKYTSVAIWIPLIDVDAQNGCLGVVEGSHRVTNAIRGPLIHQSSYQQDKEWVARFGKLIPMNAGNAIIYNHALLHYSPPNKSSVARPALNLSMVPQNVPLLHYCKPEGVVDIELYQVPDNSFYMHYNNFQRPDTGKLINTLPIGSVKVIDERMENFGKSNGIFNRLMSRLSTYYRYKLKLL